jgi:adenylate cyclase
MTLERAERTIAQDPTNCSALAMGASALNVVGDVERARDWVRRALLLDPDNMMVRYNLACSLACELNDYDQALDALEPFFANVTSTTILRHLEVDPDLNPIRDDPRFTNMLAAAKKRLGITDSAPAAEAPAPSTPA